jgi:cytochrome c oxidase subunit 3
MSTNYAKIRHPFHLVENSPWPFVSSFFSLALTVGIASYMHGFLEGFFLGLIGQSGILLIMFTWWRDIIREGTFEGRHTKKVQKGLRLGMILFIISEIMFFFAFFWTFFHSCLSATIEIGYSWPPVGIIVLSPWGIPLLNTFILLLSGLTVTTCHHSMVWGNKKISMAYLFLTLFLAQIFLWLQAFEYINALFVISDSIYGSNFFLTTGFHGFHVGIGMVFLSVCFLRLRADHFTRTHHIGFECAAFYWHMVDAVWLFLFIIVYWLCGL